MVSRYSRETHTIHAHTYIIHLSDSIFPSKRCMYVSLKSMCQIKQPALHCASLWFYRVSDGGHSFANRLDITRLFYIYLGLPLPPCWWMCDMQTSLYIGRTLRETATLKQGWCPGRVSHMTRFRYRQEVPRTPLIHSSNNTSTT